MKCQKDHNPGLEPNAKALSEEELKQVDGGYAFLKFNPQGLTSVTLPNGSNKYQYEKPIPTNKP